MDASSSVTESVKCGVSHAACICRRPHALARPKSLVAAEFHMLDGLMQQDHPLLLVCMEQSLTQHKMSRQTSPFVATRHRAGDRTHLQYVFTNPIVITVAAQRTIGWRVSVESKDRSDHSQEWHAASSSPEYSKRSSSKRCLRWTPASVAWIPTAACPSDAELPTRSGSRTTSWVESNSTAHSAWSFRHEPAYTLNGEHNSRSRCFQSCCKLRPDEKVSAKWCSATAVF
jgi:hypothetical protein